MVPKKVLEPMSVWICTERVFADKTLLSFFGTAFPRNFSMVYGIIVLELAWFISLSWIIFILKQYVLCVSFFELIFFAMMFWTSRVLQLGLLPFEFPWVFLLFELFSKLIWDVMFEHTTFVVVNLWFFSFIKLFFSSELLLVQFFLQIYCPLSKNRCIF